MATVPNRSLPAFGATRTDAVPFPVPLAEPLIVIHDARLTAVHVHAASVAIEMASVPPAGATVALAGAAMYRHGAASCVIVSCLLLTSTTARRWTASGF